MEQPTTHTGATMQDSYAAVANIQDAFDAWSEGRTPSPSDTDVVEIWAASEGRDWAAIAPKLARLVAAVERVLESDAGSGEDFATALVATLDVEVTL